MTGNAIRRVLDVPGVANNPGTSCLVCDCLRWLAISCGVICSGRCGSIDDDRFIALFSGASLAFDGASPKTVT